MLGKRTRRCFVWVLLCAACLGSNTAHAEDPVYFADANLKAAVEAALGTTDPTPTDMLGLVQLKAAWKGIASLVGMQYATNLQGLGLNNNHISDASPLSGLTNLTDLSLGGNPISDLSPLSSLTNLQTLWLQADRISDLSPLSGLTSLQYLILVSNQITDISALSGLIGLRELHLDNNAISDLTALSYLTNLTYLSLGNNQITDISPLSGLTNLIQLTLSGNHIGDLSSLTGLINLQGLGLDNNQISDLSPLSGLTNLQVLFLHHNQVSDISPLSGLANLDELYLHYNQISDISALSGMTNLQCLVLYDNPLDRDAYCIHLQEVMDSNPGLWVGLGGISVGTNANPPGAVQASDGLHGEKVTVRWDALCPGPGMTTIFQYMVYRSTSLDSAKEAVSDWLGGTSFDDTTVSPGIHYWYWVKSDYSGEDYSEPDEGWRSGPPQRTLTVSSTAGGTVSAPGIGAFQYDDGTSVPVVAVPAANYHFVNWTGTAVDAGKVDNPLSASTTVTMDGDYTLQANFALDQRTLTTSSTAGGSVITPGGGDFSYAHGTVLAVVATPEANYHFVNWTGTAVTAGKVANPSSANTTVTIDADCTLVANFAIDQHTLVVSSTTGGSVSSPGEGSFEYDHNTVVPITAVAETHYHFTGWTGTAVDAGKVANPASANTTLTVDAAYTLQANFAVNTYTLTLNATNGTVAATPEKATYTHGETVTLQAVPNTGYHFTEWTGDLSGNTNPTPLTMDGNKIVTAGLALNSYILTVNALHGSVARTPDKASYDHGETVTLLATADVGYVFTDWSGDLSGSVNPDTITMDDDKTVTANFAVRQWTLTVSASSGGAVTEPGQGAFPYDDGTTLTVVAVPDGNHHFVNWTGTAVDAGKVANPTFATTAVTMDADYSLQANFAIDRRTLTVSAAPGGAVIAPGEGTFEYDHGEVAVLQAEADPLFTFVGWRGNVFTSANPYSLTMDGDKAVSAHFESVLDVLYVDDDAATDPGPADANVSDPQEDGTPEHPFDTVQEAIDVARRGARVIVRSGTYFETIDLLGKSIEVIGLNADDPNIMPLPVIDGESKDTVVRCTQGEDPNCILRGFVITGGKGWHAGGILCIGSNPTIVNCLIVGNRATDLDAGGGIHCQDSNAVFINCTVSGNCGGSAGAGICLFQSNVTILDSIVWENAPAQIRLLGSGDSVLAYTDVSGGWPGDGILDADPLFTGPGYWADPTNLAKVLPATDPLAVWVEGDYHLMSQAGRWDLISKTWIKDLVTSPCIDAGDSDSSTGQEPLPNGDRINMGVYAGTSQASLSIGGS